MNKSIALWRDANALLLELERRVRHFPSYHKVTQDAEMRQHVMLVCRLINRAFMQTESKLQNVHQLVMSIKDLAECKLISMCASINRWVKNAIINQ